MIPYKPIIPYKTTTYEASFTTVRQFAALTAGQEAVDLAGHGGDH